MTGPAAPQDAPRSWLERVPAAVAGFVLPRPGLTLLLVAALTVAALWRASRLDFDTRLSALLPESAVEVAELEEVQRKAGGTVELVIAVGGKREARLPFARALVQRLRAQPYIRRADAEFPVDFFLDRRAWMLSTEALRKLQQAIEDEIARAKARANPFYVDLEDDEPKDAPAPWAEVDSSKDPEDKAALLKRTFESPDGKYLFLRVKPKSLALDMASMTDVLARVEQLVAGMRPGDRGLHVRYAGSLVVNSEQHRRMMSDMRRAALISLVLVLLLTAVYIRQPLGLLLLALPLVVGIGVTLGVTELTIGKLNLVSGFLVSALIGMGVAFGVHLYMRFLEYQRRAESRGDAMRRAMIDTFPACFTSATTTAGAFLAMTISDFRGFREYGMIASGGVVLTLLAAYVVLPPVALLLSWGRGARRPRAVEQAETRPYSPRAAGAVVAGGVAFLAFSLAVLPHVGWRNDFKKLRGASTAVEFYEYVQQALGGSLSPAAVMVDSVADAAKVEQILAPYRAGPTSPILRVVSLASMVPEDVAAKQKLLDELKQTLTEVRDSGKLKDEDLRKVDEALALVRAKPWTAEQIPDVFRRLFLSVDEQNTFVLLWPRSELYLDQELFAWARTLDEIRGKIRAAGVRATVLDENRIGARVVLEVRREWPRVFAYAGLAVLFFLFLDFRSPRRVALLALSLGMGTLWVVGGMFITDVQLNIFNHSVLPTVLGVGIDNAVHIQHRYDQEGPGSLRKVVRSTGAAALLASLTAGIGFGSTVIAHHNGINSLGWLAMIGIGSTFVGTTVFLPALLQTLEHWRARRRAG